MCWWGIYHHSVSMNISFPPEIRHDFHGFQLLINLIIQTKTCFLETIEINMQATTWFDADMAAAFGAILYKLGMELNTIKLTNLPPKVESILSRNGFLSYYGKEIIPDFWNTAIPYHRFDTKDDRYFAEYIEKEFLHRKEMPTMSSGLLKKFRESIFEIFSNAVIHSETELGIFSCGQFYPNKKRLTFSVVDLGIGIRNKVQKAMNLNLSAEDSIRWAIAGKNTTKKGPIPGGLGLKLLSDFIDLNEGSIQIISDTGYLQRKNRQTTTQPLKGNSFPGTVVTIEINTADTASYQLSSEIPLTDIF